MGFSHTTTKQCELFEKAVKKELVLGFDKKVNEKCFEKTKAPVILYWIHIVWLLTMKFAIQVCGLSLILTFGLTLSNPQSLGKYLYFTSGLALHGFGKCFNLGEELT